MLKRKTGKEIWSFVICLAIVSCPGAFIGTLKYGQGIESVVLFFKNFALVFFGLGLVAIAMVVVAFGVVLNKGSETLTRETISYFASRFK